MDEAVSRPHKRIAIVTFTINNSEEIKKKFYELHGSIPRNVIISTWFSFLLHELVRPYQNFLYDKKRIESIFMVKGRSSTFSGKNNIEKYYLSQDKNIYTDKISEFAVLCNEKSKNLPINRLSQIYDEIFIDEVQDLAGYDLDLIEILLRSSIKVLLVGDIRQAVYATNNSPKNKQYRGVNMSILFKKWEKSKLAVCEYLSKSYRSNQIICDFADSLYPNLPKTESANINLTCHDGIFLVTEGRMEHYMSAYFPQILRWDKKTNCKGYYGMNFGEVKGLSFDRVLIIPTGPIKTYLKTGKIAFGDSSIAKLYVAITRAKHSVAFLYSEECFWGNAQIY